MLPSRSGSANFVLRNWTDVRPEIQLILRCCSVSGSDTAPALETIAAAAGFDWRWFEEAVLEHGVTPIVARALSAAVIPEAGRPAMRRIAMAAQAIAFRNRHLVSELTRVIARFESNGVAALAFKGPMLAATAYGDIALRAFTDLDILVHRADVERAAELLVADGYGPAGFPAGVDSAIFTTFGSGFQAQRGEDLIDLHGRIRRRRFNFFPEDDSIWARSITSDLEGRRVDTFAPADLALYLCVHGAKHGWANLQLIADVARIVERCDIDLDQLLREGERSRCGRMVLLGLMLANEMLGASVAPEILQRGRADVTVEEAKRAVVDAMFCEEQIERPAENYRGIAVRLMNPSDRVRYWWWRAVTPTAGDWEFISLPKRLYAAYFAIRPVRLAIQFVRSRMRRKARADGSVRSVTSEFRI